MKNKNERRETRFFSPAECAVLKGYLEEKALKGWLLKYLKGNTYVFEKAAPQELRYEVELLVNAHSPSEGFTPDMLAYIDRCAAAGWRFVYTQKNIAVFATTGTEPLPTLTDERAKLRFFKNQIVREAAALLAVFSLGLLYVLLRIYRNGIFSVIADNAVVLLAPLFLFGVSAAFVRIIRLGKWAVKQNARLCRGVALYYPSKGGRLRIKKAARWTVLGFYGLWSFGNLALLREKECYFTVIRTVAVFLFIILILLFTHILRTQSGLRKMLYSFLFTVAGLFMSAFMFYLIVFFPKLTDTLTGGCFQVRSSALASYATFTEEFFFNKSSGSIIVFTTDIDPLRELYLKNENVLFAGQFVYDANWEADTVTVQNGIQYVFYGDSVVRLPADFLPDKNKIRGLRLYIDRFTYEMDIFTQTDQAGEVAS